MKPKGKPRSKKNGKKGEFNPNKVYEMITERFIKYIDEHGQLPWRMPWMKVQPDLPPMNYTTKKPYEGMNMFLCLMSGYQSPYWMSYNQAREHGGYVREGEKGIKVIKYQPPNSKKIKEIEEDDSLTDEEKAEAKSKVWGFYKIAGTVFNAEQIEGIDFPEPEAVELPEKIVPIEEAERVVRDMPNPPKITSSSKPRAYYNPLIDTIHMPDTFFTPEGYYSTLFHEIGHSTGHSSRLGRLKNQKNVAFGSKDYSFEELVAELCSSFVMNEIGLENQDTERNSAAYLDSWRRTMKADVKMLLKAMNKAIPATHYIFGRELQQVA